MNTSTSISEFNKTIEELLYFGDCLKLREKQIEQQYVTEFNKEKKQIEEVQQINKTLAEQIEESTKNLIDLNEKYATLNTKYMCCLQELNQFKSKCQEKNIQINKLGKHILALKNDQIKREGEHRDLLEKNKNDSIQSVEKTILENEELKKILAERDNEIIQLNEQIEKLPKDVEERLSERIVKLQTDFGIMFNEQSTFFLEKIALLKKEQQHNITKLCRY